ncbi:hypothetical protein R20943_03117 [Paraburkholderia aspalathi]|nr:hypothetical protein R20943_03117 [Paraburkholderia aspalathi]
MTYTQYIKIIALWQKDNQTVFRPCTARARSTSQTSLIPLSMELIGSFSSISGCPQLAGGTCRRLIYCFISQDTFSVV